MNRPASKGNILLVNPWIIDFAAYDYFIKPVGLLTIGHVLKKQGYTISLLDCLDRHHPSLKNNKIQPTGHFVKTEIQKPDILSNIPRKLSRYGLPKETVVQFLKFQKPDVILITSGMTYWYPGVFEMIELLKEFFPRVPIILGGIYASLCLSHAKTNCGADYLVKGDGVSQAISIIDNITNNQSNIDQYSDFTKYPWPLYELYSNIYSAVMLTSYGCPFRCPFCASYLLSPGFIRKDPFDVAKEIYRLFHQLKIRDFAFYDDALLFKKEEHLEIILREVIKNKCDVNFHTPNGLSPKQIDSNIAQLMHQSKFETIRLSFESSDPDRQKAMTSKITNEDLINSIKTLRDAGFQTKQIGCYVLMGLPDQSVNEVKESIKFVFEQGIRVNLASFTPVPGTVYWKKTCKINHWHDDVDPLLTNNAIFPLKNENFTWDQFIQLQTWVSNGNQLIAKGDDPIRNPDFIKKGRNI